MALQKSSSGPASTSPIPQKMNSELLCPKFLESLSIELLTHNPESFSLGC
ncbi:hypothetical protein NC652_010307 [Populus alba x Populus x berolinensis]|nr:hypothetical protein NC652_010307 [Populus alba x Populus x berolinensis]